MMCKSTMLLALSCMVKRQMVPCVAMAKAVVAILIQPLLGGRGGQTAGVSYARHTGLESWASTLYR